MRNYEILLVIHPDQSEQIPNMIDRYMQVVTNHQGKIHRHEDWGRRQLAYSIQDVHKAHYVLLNIECNQAQLDELQTTFRFNDAIIRPIITKTDKPITSTSPMMSEKKDEKSGDNNHFQRRSKISPLAGISYRSIDYKNIPLLRKFITETGKIIPARVTGTTAKQQRQLTSKIKLARKCAFLPFCHSH